MLWDSSCGPFTRQTKNSACWDIMPAFQCSSSSRKYSLTLYIICCPGDRSGGQSITLYIRLIQRDKACTCTCMLGLIQLSTLFLFSDHFQSTVELLKGVDKYIIKLVTLVSVVYSNKSWVDWWSIYYILCILIPQGGLWWLFQMQLHVYLDFFLEAVWPSD